MAMGTLSPTLNYVRLTCSSSASTWEKSGLTVTSSVSDLAMSDLLNQDFHNHDKR